MKSFRGFAVCATAAVALIHAGIASALPRFEKSARVKWADEAGSVTVSPISVTRWEDAAGSLQPKFSLTTEEALGIGITNTMLSDEKISSALRMGLALSLPTHSVSTTFHTTGPQDAAKTDVDQVDTRSRGAVPSSVPDAIERTAAALAGLPDTTLGQEPSLRYLAATALYQEVQLLNRYVQDAVRFQGGQAFLVRLQLSVLPGRRALPYDVISDITIHPEDIQADAGLAERDVIEALTVERSAGRSLEPPPIPKAAVCSGKVGHPTVQVVPLVVTDSVEGLAASRTTDDSRQFALALAATIANVGASGNFAHTLETIRRAVGEDTNSLLTLARLNDDTVRVRLGAAQSPRYGQTMLARTHPISLLVIYRPCDPTAVSARGDQKFLTAVTRASFIDSFTGQTLPYEPAGPRLIRLTRELNRKYNNNLSYLDYAGLYLAMSRQDFDSFSQFFKDRVKASRPDCKGLSNTSGTTEALARLLGKGGLLEPRNRTALQELYSDPRYAGLAGKDGDKGVPRCLQEELAAAIAPNTLWTDLQAIRPFPEYSYTRIPVVLEKLTPQFPPVQDALVSMGEDGTSVTLYDGAHLSSLRQLTASLDFIIPPAKAEKPPAPAVRARHGRTKTRGASPSPTAAAPASSITLRAKSVAVSPDGTSITAAFPAVAPLLPEGVEAKDVKFSNLMIEVGRVERPWDLAVLCTDSLCPARSDPSHSAAMYARLHSVAPPKKQDAAMDFVLAAPASSVVVGPDGKARLTVMIQQKPPKTPSADAAKPKPMPILTVEGAEVVSATFGSGSLAQTAWGWQTPGAGAVTLVLDGLVPAQTVTVGLVRVDAEKGSSTPAAEPLHRPVYGRMASAKE